MAAARSSRELDVVRDDEDGDAIEGEITTGGPTDDKVLTIGGKDFVCAPQLPLATVIRHSNNGLLGVHHLLVKIVDKDDVEAMWDEFETLDEDEVQDVIKAAYELYSDRPTKERSSSSGRSKRTGTRSRTR